MTKKQLEALRDWVEAAIADEGDESEWNSVLAVFGCPDPEYDEDGFVAEGSECDWQAEYEKFRAHVYAMGGVRKCDYPRCYTPVTSLGVALPHGGRELTEAMETAVQLRDHHGKLQRSLPEGLLYWVEEADKTRQRLEEQLQAIMDAMNAYVGAQAQAGKGIPLPVDDEELRVRWAAQIMSGGCCCRCLVRVTPDRCWMMSEHLVACWECYQHESGLEKE